MFSRFVFHFRNCDASVDHRSCIKDYRRSCSSWILEGKNSFLGISSSKILPCEIKNFIYEINIFYNLFDQVFTFNNLFNIIHISDGVDRVTSLVMFLLADERLEVREKAAQVTFQVNFTEVLIMTEKEIFD